MSEFPAIPLSNPTNCLFLHLKPSTGYVYGCRCERCRGWNREYRVGRRWTDPRNLRSCSICPGEFTPSRGETICPDCRFRYARRISQWKRHNASWEQMASWIIDPRCWICEKPIDLDIDYVGRYDSHRADVAVDHDPQCCVTKYGCGRCIRGLTHFECNRLLAALEKLIREWGLPKVIDLANMQSERDNGNARYTG